MLSNKDTREVMRASSPGMAVVQHEHLVSKLKDKRLTKHGTYALCKLINFPSEKEAKMKWLHKKEEMLFRKLYSII